MNITIVGMEYEKVKNIAQAISQLLSCQCVDFSLLFEQELLVGFDCPLTLANVVMQQKEKALLKNLLKENATIIHLQDDVFLSNENYKLLKNSLTILIEFELKDKILLNIQKLLKKHTKIYIKEKNLNINKLIDAIRG